LVGLLADADRRRVVAALILGASTADDIAVASDLEERVVVTALNRLSKAGLVESVDGRQYFLLEEAFRLAARREAPPPRPSGFPDRPIEERRILDQAFQDGRLVRLPSKHSHRLVVLDLLAQRFEPGERYSERQVNATLSELHADTATLRRYLVDVGMLDRSEGFYWRSGGSFSIE
jgi:hypothetical protein